MQQEAMIRLEGVTKVFYTDDLETHALDGIHLDVAKGEFLSISGPSGCGKSTLLAILGLLDSPTEGRYLLAGDDFTVLTPAARAKVRNERIGFIFQAFNLIGDLTVLQNVELPLTYRQNMSGDERRNHHPAQLSGGQQQRVAVARALAGRPSILLADEPTGNLDSRNGEAVMNLLRELHREGSTICMVTHDPRYADYADRKVQLFDGRVMDENTMIDLSSRRAAKA
jgi:putative ABC transport system ATP-binding protein